MKAKVLAVQPEITIMLEPESELERHILAAFAGDGMGVRFAGRTSSGDRPGYSSVQLASRAGGDATTWPPAVVNEPGEARR